MPDLTNVPALDLAIGLAFIYRWLPDAAGGVVRRRPADPVSLHVNAPAPPGP
jgi:hypothetical protein